MAWVGAAVAVCGTLALRDTAAVIASARINPALLSANVREEVAWNVAYGLMWLALTPLIFALARRVPFRRDRWRGPFVFHLATSVPISALAPVVLTVLFGGLVLGRGWPASPAELVTPFWTGLILYRAVADTSFYWLILAAGFIVCIWDEDQARRRRAADLERALVDAQVDALKMKLQPHFLFNTLNSIGFLAVEKDTEAVVTMVERLGGLLRSSMRSDGRQVATVAEEIALLDQYLAIEEVRFADRLRVVRRIDPAAAKAWLPSLILQPIIENSIKHGFSRRIGASSLEIAARLEGETLIVTVEDDGPGLPAGWKLATHCGRGLKNVIERLDKIYASAWTLTLSNRPLGGILVDLRVPASPPGFCRT